MIKEIFLFDVKENKKKFYIIIDIHLNFYHFLKTCIIIKFFFYRFYEKVKYYYEYTFKFYFNFNIYFKI